MDETIPKKQPSFLRKEHFIIGIGVSVLGLFLIGMNALALLISPPLAIVTIILSFFILGAAAIGALLYFFLSLKKNAKPFELEVNKLASEMNFVVRKDMYRLFTPPTARPLFALGNYRGRNIAVRAFSPGITLRLPVYIDIQLHQPIKDPCVVLSSTIPGMGFMFGKKATTGDPAFDEKYTLRCNDEQYALQLMSQNIKNMLSRLTFQGLGIGSPTFFKNSMRFAALKAEAITPLGDNVLTQWFTGLYDEPERLKEYIDHACNIADELDKSAP